MHRMYEGIPSSETSQSDGVAFVNSQQAVAAAKSLGQAICKGELDLFALFSSRETPTRLHNQALIEAAFPNSTVLSFIYVNRNQQAPFGLSWRDLEELKRDPLCVEETAFRGWLKKQARKKAWPCHQLSSKARQPRGRPSYLIDEAIEVIEKLDAQGKLKPSMGNKEVHALVQKARGSLRDISPDTVRRARKQSSYQGAR